MGIDAQVLAADVNVPSTFWTVLAGVQDCPAIAGIPGSHIKYIVAVKVFHPSP